MWIMLMWMTQNCSLWIVVRKDPNDRYYTGTQNAKFTVHCTLYTEKNAVLDIFIMRNAQYILDTRY